jgi:tagatose-1,6-bisphosphate aldolase non-catalytic subunit AgaZ/GatZ
MRVALQQKQSSGEKLKDLLKQNRHSGSVGVYSVCSAHAEVIEAAIQQAMVDEAVFVVESTSRQVNQTGGYTGQTPQEFAKSIRSAAKRAGLAADQVCSEETTWGHFPGETRTQPLQWKERTS